MERSIKVILAFSLLFAMVSRNPLEWVLTIVAAWVMLSKFLRPREHPVLLMALIIPFVEITTSLINAELGSNELNDLFGSGGQKAYLLSIIAFILFMAGLLLGLKKTSRFPVLATVELRLRQIPMRRLVSGHLAMHGLSILTQSLFSYGSSLFQLVLHFSKFPLIFLYLIVWKYSLQRENRGLVVIIFLSNLALRLGGFFSDWKELIFLLVYVAFISQREFDSRWIKRMFTVGIAGGLFLFTWQAVKAEYREYLNGGSRSQRVVVSFDKAILKFSELTSDYWFSSKTKENDLVMQATLDRIGYLDFFARTIPRVPKIVPHEGGSLMVDNLTFALLPRVLFPNKGFKNDQLKVEKYAGVDIADNASFSLGRYAEWYVDFGLGMLWIALMAGYVGAVMLRLVAQTKSNIAENFVDPIFLVLVMQNYCSYQSDEVVVYGQTFWALVVYAGIGRRIFIGFLKR